MITSNGTDPRNPNRLFTMAYYLTTIGAGLLLADNWKRLGKPEWVRPTQIAALISLPLALVCIILGIALATTNHALLILIFVGAGAALGINFGVLLALIRAQSGPYKAWKQGGIPAMLAFPYKSNTTRNTFIVVFCVCMVGMVGLAILVSASNS